ncbi:hypothetical protein [Deinococcus saxicola]
MVHSDDIPISKAHPGGRQGEAVHFPDKKKVGANIQVSRPPLRPAAYN